MAITAEELDLIRTVMIVLNSISLVASFIVIITYLRFKRDFPRSLALFFSIGSFLLALVFLSQFVTLNQQRFIHDHVSCVLQGFFLTYIGNVTILWFLFIALDVYITIVLVKNVIYQRRLQIWFHIIAWGLPIILASIPLIRREYSNRQLWCWISDHNGGLWEFLCFYGPMALIAIIASYCWTRAIIIVCSISTITRKSHSYLYRHVVFIICFIVILLVTLTNRIYGAINEKDPLNFYLTLCHVIALGTNRIHLALENLGNR
eukprot:TRINITY_DN5690_c0_g2_i3.p1 TRINITY_DN5690_c0_g2~~TRINITY_DN5690_c0_g2_i3.p1  ORF type:complete len:262 (-),score=-4.66 TRINITY_DN5690_c0_g2_i3:87-872(-)